ncbi:hypothetical protein EYF80_034957 [Liparis tanakae]|uniref:Uncharacterized protein n=1 Tax=Liparis tanakae TaxID=230148 RepID=A0A4Z2GMI5_9TELE|nr:hypothetical protein EYF80_034957 [Liparis tanakae]
MLSPSEPASILRAVRSQGWELKVAIWSADTEYESYREGLGPGAWVWGLGSGTWGLGPGVWGLSSGLDSSDSPVETRLQRRKLA